uniref:G-protein coupled receptors family 3 profile domain-containing protein n=1 Tax=Callorhinchus milii TaxID=7868 RepID=A0A4W3I4I8_CALMI
NYLLSVKICICIIHIIIVHVRNLTLCSFAVRALASQPEDFLLLPSFDFRAFRLAQTMIFAIEEINQNSALLPNVALGYRIYDDCSSSTIATKAALSLINDIEETVSGENCRERSRISALIGGGSSLESIAVTRFISPFNIPLVSYFSTCACLSNRKEFPTFYRTIPSDSYQSKVLAFLVRKFGWNWIGTIRVNNDYGNFGMQTFIDTVHQLGVCIAFSESFYRTDPIERITDIVQTVKRSSTKVVVAFCATREMRILFKELLRQNVTDIQWIGSEAWVTSDTLTSQENTQLLVGTVGTAIRRSGIPGLRDFLLSVHPSRFPDNTLVKEFWETAFKCTLRSESASSQRVTSGSRQCTGKEHLEDLQTAYSYLKIDGPTCNVYKAVYAFAHAFHHMFSCERGKGPFMNNTCLLHYMQSVNFTTLSGDNVYFDVNGDPVGTYDLINWQINSEGKAEMKIIGYYDGSAAPGQEVVLNEKDIIWSGGQTEVRHPLSPCTSCPRGSRKVIQKGQPICCFDCTQCSEGEISNVTGELHTCQQCPWDYWSNRLRDQCLPKATDFLSYTEPVGAALASLALTGLCTTLVVAAVFFQSRHTPIVKANNSELSFLLLFALWLCFLCALAFIGEPSGRTCKLRRGAFSVSFVLCLSCVLVKTVLVLLAFKTTVPNNSVLRWFDATKQRLSVFILTFVQSFICALWLTLSPPFPLKNTEYYEDIIILECAVGSVTAFYWASAYIALLSCVCFLIAFFTRKLPDNFNEAKCITFSMLIHCAVWITYIPVYVSSPGRHSVAVEVFAILMSSFALLVCIFAPKCYIILLKPAQNTKKHLMGKEPSKRL